GELSLPEGEAEGYGVSPALLDAALQAVAALVDMDGEAPLLPFELGRFVVHRLGASAALVRIERLPSSGADEARARVRLVDEAGSMIAQIDALTLRRADLSALGRANAGAADDAFYRLEWQSGSVPEPAASVTGRWRVLSTSEAAESATLVAELRALGADAE